MGEGPMDEPAAAQPEQAQQPLDEHQQEVEQQEQQQHDQQEQEQPPPQRSTEEEWGVSSVILADVRRQFVGDEQAVRTAISDLKTAESNHQQQQVLELQSIFADLSTEDILPVLQEHGGSVEACLGPLLDLSEQRKRELRQEDAKREQERRHELRFQEAEQQLNAMFQGSRLTAERVKEVFEANDGDVALTADQLLRETAELDAAPVAPPVNQPEQPKQPQEPQNAALENEKSPEEKQQQQAEEEEKERPPAEAPAPAAESQRERFQSYLRESLIEWFPSVSPQQVEVIAAKHNWDIEQAGAELFELEQQHKLRELDRLHSRLQGSAAEPPTVPTVEHPPALASPKRSPEEAAEVLARSVIQVRANAVRRMEEDERELPLEQLQRSILEDRLRSCAVPGDIRSASDTATVETGSGRDANSQQQPHQQASGPASEAPPSEPDFALESNIDAPQDVVGLDAIEKLLCRWYALSHKAAALARTADTWVGLFPSAAIDAAAPLQWHWLSDSHPLPLELQKADGKRPQGGLEFSVPAIGEYRFAIFGNRKAVDACEAGRAPPSPGVLSMLGRDWAPAFADARSPALWIGPTFSLEAESSRAPIPEDLHSDVVHPNTSKIQVLVQQTSGSPNHPNAWLGLYPAAEDGQMPVANDAPVFYEWLASAPALDGQASRRQINFEAPHVGQWELRLFADRKAVFPIACTQVAVLGEDWVKLSRQGPRMTVSVNCMSVDPQTRYVAMGLYHRHEPNHRQYRRWSVLKTRGLSVIEWTPPTHAGEYEVRLFVDRNYTCVLRSEQTITVIV